MVYHSRSDGVQPEVRHAVSSYYHGALLFVERVYDGLQGMGVAVQVIAVKLYGEASAPGVVDCEVPASPYAQIGTLGLKVDYRFVVLVLTDDFCGSVCRVIVHDDDVEWKACFLCECRPDGIVNGTGAIAHGDDDGGFIFEISFLYIRFHTYGFKEGIDGFQVSCECFFHFYLYFPVTGIYVVELLFAGQAVVAFCFRIKIFVDMYQMRMEGKEQTQFIKGGILSFLCHLETGEDEFRSVEYQ